MKTARWLTPFALVALLAACDSPGGEDGGPAAAGVAETRDLSAAISAARDLALPELRSSELRNCYAEGDVWVVDAPLPDGGFVRIEAPPESASYGLQLTREWHDGDRVTARMADDGRVEVSITSRADRTRARSQTGPDGHLARELDSVRSFALALTDC